MYHFLGLVLGCAYTNCLYGHYNYYYYYYYYYYHFIWSIINPYNHLNNISFILNQQPVKLMGILSLIFIQ